MSISLLASYPKSGNTWFRALLTSIWSNGEEIDLDRMSIPNAADRVFCNRFLGINSADLTREELNAVRPRIYEFALQDPSHRPFLKVHDAWLPPFPGGPPPFSESAIEAVLYIVRDPRDVAISFANHLGISIDRSIRNMGNPRYMLASYPKTLRLQMPQLLSSWSAHVRSWVQQSPYRVHLLRYEDMLADPENVFGAALSFAGVNISRAVLRRAVAATRFDVLKAKEEKFGFKERPDKAEKFFRRGKARGWEDTLTPEQVARIESDQRDVMRWLGYSLVSEPHRAHAKLAEAV